MLTLIDILIILSGLSAAQASPLRRYANTTSHASDAITGVAYQPYAGSPSLSLAPIQGITTLPFSQLLESPADAFPTSSTSSQVVASSTAPITRAASSTSQSFRADSPPASFSTFGGQHADTTVTITTISYTTVQAPPPTADSHPSQVVRSSKAQTDGIPTDFSTFGGKPADVIVTRTTTTYTTLSANPRIEESHSSRSMHSSATNKTAITSATDTSTTANAAKDQSPTFVYDPLTTSTLLSLLETMLSTTITEASTAETSPSLTAQQPHATSRSGGPYPYPSSIPTTTSDAQSSQQRNNLESSSSPETSADLPDVVNGDPDSMQATVATFTSDTTALPGITIVPQNPSVIYITVTDAGATTTVTDSEATKTETDRVAATTVTADWARGDPFEQRRRHLGEH